MLRTIICIYVLLFFFCNAEDKKPFEIKELLSGSSFSQQETRLIQDDDFLNPGFLWIEHGEKLWNKKNNKNEQSCNDCHGKVISMKGIATKYPKFIKSQNKVINLEQRINLCKRINKEKEFATESKDLLSLSALISLQSRGLPLSVDIDGLAQEWFEKGKMLYFQKIGQMNLSCNQCHDDRVGQFLRAEKVSQGQINGFPAYLLRWGQLASVHKRIQFCNEQARAEALPIFSDDYNALQLYIAWRGNGLIMESPSVRK